MYIQKMVPPYFPMLYLNPNYDVISYRIEYIKTNEKAELSEEEAEALGLSAKDAKKYRIGMKYEPFLRIYRTTAPHPSVEKFVKNGGDLLGAFKKPSLIQDAKEEICFSTIFAAANEIYLDSGKKSISDGILFKRLLDEAIDDEDRRKFKIAKNSNKSIQTRSFKRKCLAIDAFFEKEKAHLEDPQKYYGKEITNNSVKDLSRIFDECDHLDKYTPSGFAEATSIFDESMLIRILTVITFLKWQIGLAENLNDSILTKTFRTKNVLWSEIELTSFSFFANGISEADFATEKETFQDAYNDIKKSMKANPHKNEHYEAEGSAKPPGIDIDAIMKQINALMIRKDNPALMKEDNPEPLKVEKKKFFQIKFKPAEDIGGIFPYYDDVLYMYYNPVGAGTIKSYWGGKMLKRTKKILEDITIKDDVLEGNKEKAISVLFEKVKVFYKDFIEGILKKDIERYPPFIQDLLNDKEKYMGNLIYAFYDENGDIKDPLTTIKAKDLKFNGYLEGTIFEDKVDYSFIFDFIVEGNARKNINEFIFNILYLSDYSDVIKLAYKSEQSKLSIYKSLQKIKALDPSDTIAERFLALFVDEWLERTRSEFIDKWDKFLGNSAFLSANTQEERVVEAFKIYHRTMQSIIRMLEKANEFDPIISFNNDPNRLPSLYKSVKDFILYKLRSYSLVPVNREFDRDAVNSNIDIIPYVMYENEKARLTRNKFAHGMDISKEEYLQFDNFCRRITRIADTLEKIYTKKLKDIEGK